MKITFLGTGSGVPAKHRNVSSLALQFMNGTTWLFDCGEATQHQILHTSIKPRRIEKIFITHLHGDHIYGLPGLLGTRSFQGGESPLTIYGTTGIEDFIQVSLKISGTYLKYPLYIKEIESNAVLMEEEDWRVTTAQLKHGISSYGFRLEQKDQLGPLLIEKIKAAGIPPGPHLRQLKNGQDITIEGHLIHSKDFIGPPKKGKVITVLGDTRYTEESVTLSEGADLLIHEGTFSSRDYLIAEEYFHSTTTQAAEIARREGVSKLIMNHISSRYQGDDVKTLLEEAREVFPNTYIAEDLSVFEI